MRWKVPKYSDTRYVKRYLWYPVAINGERRWLEIAYIEQFRLSAYWINYRWSTEEIYLKDLNKKQNDSTGSC